MAVVYLKVPMVIIFKNTSRANAKTRIKVFKNKHIDDLIDVLNSPRKKLVGIPKTAEILQVGCGTKFEAEYRKKYKL